jgi:DNA-binding MarR family transcriptional regulator
MRKRQGRLALIPPVHRATHRIGLFLQSRRGLGVSQGEAHLLAQLAEAGPCTVGQLHEAFAHRRSTLTSILDRLEERGLVRREVRPDDRRSFLVTLTPTGSLRARRVRAALAALEALASSRVSAAQLAGFAAVVSALADAARRAASRGAEEGK